MINFAQIYHDFASVDTLALVIFLFLATCGGIYVTADVALRHYMIKRPAYVAKKHDAPTAAVTRQMVRLTEYRRMREILLSQYPHADIVYRPTACDLMLRFQHVGILICCPVEVDYAEYRAMNDTSVRLLIDQIRLHELQEKYAETWHGPTPAERRADFETMNGEWIPPYKSFLDPSADI